MPLMSRLCLLSQDPTSFIPYQPSVSSGAAQAKSLQHMYYDVARATDAQELFDKPIFR